MEIGTHNSMTYLKPKKWYLYPFQFLAKCQNKTIKQQYNEGVRLFDIRISYTKNKEIEFRHGLMAYKGNVYKTLKYLNSQKDKVKVRILLEKSNLESDNMFIYDLKHFQETFTNITFYEGRKKNDWEQLLPLPTLDICQLVSSMAGEGLFKLWPWLYAKVFNKSNIKNYSEKKPLLIDFL